MSNFISDSQSLKPSFSFLDVDPNMEILDHFPELNPSVVEASNLNYQSFMGDNFFIQQEPEFPGNLEENFPGIFHHDQKNVIPIYEPILTAENDSHASKKRKGVSGKSSPPVSENGVQSKHSSGRGKRMKGNDKKKEKAMDVVHVRARRGQATDSHSIAERVRRGKINEKLRCLQDIVPGCYKTMGMAVTLDEIINYVRSLQTQVEFLSMKLTAASTIYDFNLEAEPVKTIQSAYDESQQIKRGGYEEVGSTQIGPLDLTFGSYPPLPYNA